MPKIPEPDAQVADDEAEAWDSNPRPMTSTHVERLAVWRTASQKSAGPPGRELSEPNDARVMRLQVMPTAITLTETP